MLFGIRRTPVESVRFKKKKEFRIRENKIFPQNSFSLHKIDSKGFFSPQNNICNKIVNSIIFFPPQNEIFSLTKLSKIAYFFFYQIVFHMWKYEQILWIYSFRQCIVLSIKSLQLNCSDPPPKLIQFFLHFSRFGFRTEERNAENKKVKCKKVGNYRGSK